MPINNYKIRLLVGLIGIVTVMNLPTLTLAAEEVVAVETKTSNTNPAAQPTQGTVTPLTNNLSAGTKLFCKRDFGAFLLIGMDFFAETFWAVWKDVLVRYNVNYCHYRDIESLVNRQEQMRQQLRRAFYACDNNTIQRLKPQYYELDAEIYFAREYFKFVAFSTCSEEPVPQDVLKQKVQINQDFEPIFKNTLVQRQRTFSANQADALFNKLKAKYDSKLSVYANCCDPEWGTMMLKIKNIGKNLSFIANLHQRFVSRTESRYKATQARIEANPGISPINSVFNAADVGSIWSRMIDVRLNGESLLKGTKADGGEEGSSSTSYWRNLVSGKGGIVQSWRDNAPGINNTPGGAPSTAPGAYNYNSARQDLQLIKVQEMDANMDAIYFTEYELKYRLTSDIALSDNVGYLIELQKVIEGIVGKDVLGGIQSCTDSILRKQCSNKPLILYFTNSGVPTPNQGS